MSDTFNKKEREKKRRKKQQEKAERKKQRKLEGKKEVEYVYVDENGNLSSTPPDPLKKKKINVEDIAISTPRKGEQEDEGGVREGKVKFFNTEKGYGFIIDKVSGESYFVHADNTSQAIDANDKVSFEISTGPKGLLAINVNVIA